jgi:hypothetical protein
VNKQIGECDDEVEVGCQSALWEGEGKGVETKSATRPQQKGGVPHRKQDPETRIGPISRQACIQQQLSVEGH